MQTQLTLALALVLAASPWLQAALIPSGPSMRVGEARDGALIQQRVQAAVADPASRCRPGGVFSSKPVLEDCYMPESQDRDITKLRDGHEVRAALCSRYLKLVTDLCIGSPVRNATNNNGTGSSNTFDEPPASSLDSILSTFGNKSVLCPALITLDESTLSSEECSILCFNDLIKIPILPLCTLVLWAEIQRVKLDSTKDSRNLVFQKSPELFNLLTAQKTQHGSIIENAKEPSIVSAGDLPPNAISSTTSRILPTVDKTKSDVQRTDSNIKPVAKSSANSTQPLPKTQNETENVIVPDLGRKDEKVPEERDSMGDKVEDKLEKPSDNLDPDVSLENDGESEVNYQDIPLPANELKNEELSRSSGPRDGSLTANGNNVYTTSGRFVETEDSHFMEYFLIVCLVVILGYVAFHNKHKLLGLIVEGRRSNNRRRGSGPAYRKLNHTLEEAVNSAPPSHNPNIVY